MLNEVKESILNAYERKTGMNRVKLSHMMDDETWFNAKKAVELGFADRVLFDADDEGDSKKKQPEKPTEEEDREENDGEDGDDEKKKKLPFRQDSLLYSKKAVNDSFLSKVADEKTVPIDQLDKRLGLLKC